MLFSLTWKLRAAICESVNFVFWIKKIIQCRNGKPDFHDSFLIHCIKRSQFHAISDFVYKTMKSSNALLSYNLKNIVYQCISRGDTYKICNYARWNHHKSFDFRTLSSANFLGSWHILDSKLKSYYKIWSFWSQLGLQMI